MTRVRSVLVLALVLLTGCTASPPTPSESSPPSTAASVVPDPPIDALPSADPEPSESAPADAPSATPLDTTGWTTYVSEHYGLRMGHPPNWSVTPAERGWTSEEDLGVVDSEGQEAFLSPAGDMLVTVWSTPYAGERSLASVQRWAERYCAESGGTRCATLGERSVRLCSGSGCLPGLLVPFQRKVQAFFLGGAHGERLHSVAIWRTEYWVADRGTARELLGAFLSTMDVHAAP